MSLSKQKRDHDDDDDDVKILTDINDNCLEFIFRQLNINDLSSLGSCCKRFFYLSRKVFVLVHGKNFMIQEIVIQEYEYVLQMFGDLMTNVTVNVHVRPHQNSVHSQVREAEDSLRKTYKKIQKHCSNMECLEIKISYVYNDFLNIPRYKYNWYNNHNCIKNIVQMQEQKENSDLLFEIKCDNDLNDFITNFNDYLKQHI